MSSRRHYANIVGDFNRMGVGVHIDGSTLWATFDFLKGTALAIAPILPVAPAPAPPAGTAPRADSASPFGSIPREASRPHPRPDHGPGGRP